MKVLTHVLPATLLTVGVALTPVSLVAEDIEIYYSEVLSDDSVNKNVANVMIMLDTSGSMRWCQQDGGFTGSNPTWCPNINNRRINQLHTALESILDEAPDNVNIGLGRFSGSTGGRVMVPVIPVNDLTRQYFDDALSEINPNGFERNPPSNVMPMGGTPTSLAFEEMARYMLGRSIGTSQTGGYSDNFCVENELEEQCTTDYVYSEGTPVEYCDVSLDNCSEIYGSWQPLPVNQSCTASDTCQIKWSNWIEYNWWQSQPACPSSAAICEYASRLFYRAYRTGVYEKRQIEYLQSDVLNEVTYCEMVETGNCAVSRQIASGSNYISPSVSANQCETNHVILFTDGRPSGDRARDVSLISCSGTTEAQSYNCQVALANHLNRDNNSISRPVKTHNIGLYMGEGDTLSDMTRVSTAGGGATYNSDDADSLLLAFQQTLNLIADEASTMVSPGVAISQSERFQHLDEMYYALFKPIQSSFWQGNLKRYRVDIRDGGSTVRDVQGRNAVDSTGAFDSNARSWWSSSNDGADVTKGGARERLSTTSRRLFYTPAPGAQLRRFNLADFTNAQLLLPSQATDAVRQNVENELLTMWGDPLHSQPIMVNYGGTTVGNNFVENNIVFVSTNAGMLHAIDTHNGDEKFAFMPHEFMSQASSYTVNRLPLTGSNKRQTYGLDGTWTAWRQAGANLESAPSRVMIYGGMRRGGNSYYALNVTNVSEPRLAWQITGGSGDFRDLGQTWSTPKVTRFPAADGGSIPVVIFGGGYSPDDHDDDRSRQTQDAKGNAIYAVNANTGELVWSAGGRSNNVTTHVSTMTHAIPGSIAVADLNSNGVADHLYFADLGGQVFRADIDASSALNHKVVRLATVGGSGQNHRRFYEQPTVAYVRDGASQSLFVTFASGYRAHPLNSNTQEAIFVLRDQQPFGGAERPAATINDFTNVTSGSLPDSTKRGWFYNLNRTEGEKALSSPVVFNNRVLFTTYAPNVESEANTDPCSVNYGATFLHQVDLLTGKAMNFQSVESPGSRRQQLQQTGLPPRPTILFGEDGSTAILVGSETLTGLEPDLLKRLRQGRWMQLTPDAAGAIKLPEDSNDETTPGD